MAPRTALSSLLGSLPADARLLIVRLRSLGDTLLLTPALRALKQWRPDLRLSVLLYQPFAPILAGNADVEEVIAFDPHGAGSALRVAGVIGTLRRRRFAACFNLHGGTMSALLTRVSGAPRRAGFAHFRLGFAYTHRVPHPRVILGREQLHSVEQQIAFFYACGLPAGEIPPLQIYAQEQARASVAEKLAARGLAPGTPYAVLHPIANFYTKEWPPDRYAALAGWLEAEHGLRPVLTGGVGEGHKLEAVAQASREPLARLDSLTIPELTALVEGAALFVGNDSGPAHIAAALQRPLVVLFGSSNSVAWRPWRAPHEIVQNDYACNPCRGDRCYAFEQPECILSITVERVRAAVARLLAAARPERTGVSLGTR
jgi:heptosyltransferase-3